MTQMQITVISVEPKQATSTKGKPYSLVEIIYKNHTFNDKVDTAKVNQYSTVFAVAKAMQPGQSYEVVKEKDSSGYYQWLSIVPTVAGIPATSPAAAYVAKTTGQTLPTTAPNTASPVKSTYETSEERAAKQVYIVKQSSLSNAIALLSVGQKAPPKTEEVIAVAQTFTDFVFGTESKPTPVSVVDMEDDIPY
jgi:hypothetical protein